MTLAPLSQTINFIVVMNIVMARTFEKKHRKFCSLMEFFFFTIAFDLFDMILIKETWKSKEIRSKSKQK